MPPKRKVKVQEEPEPQEPFVPTIGNNYPTIFRETPDEQKRALHETVCAEENHYRQLFAQDRDNELLNDPNLMLVPVHENSDLFVFEELSDAEKAIPTVFSAEASRVAHTEAIVDERSFKKNFVDLFTEGQLRYMNWDNVFACGGAVLASLMPTPGAHGENNSTIRNYYHNVAYGGADVDLFIYGLTPEEANEKMKEIYFCIKEANPYEVVAFRSKHAVTLVSQYPMRHIQIILRLYKSPAEVLMGFDVDSCSLGYDGERVLMTPRCHRSIVFQANTVDMSRRSPSYEQRLAKYSTRGFAVQVPTLDRTKVDPQLFERRFDQLQGLARLLLLERLGTPEKRTQYKDLMRLLKLRPSRQRQGYFGRRKHVDSDRLISGADASDYSAVYLPWGANYTAKSLRKIMYTKDVLLNSEFFDPNKKIHTHPCFFGTIDEILGDCCGACPPVPPELVDPDAPYVSGRLTWITVNPGAQAQIGSFHPITEGDWTAGAYVSEQTWQLSAAVNSNNVLAIRQLLQQDIDVNGRDSLGRTPLHIAAYSNSVEAADALLKAGARLSSVTPEGRNAVLICAMYGHTELLSLLLEHGEVLANQDMDIDEDEEEEEEEEEDEDFESIKAQVERKKKEAKKQLEAADAFLSEKKADSLDLEVSDYDLRMTALHMACFFGQVEAARVLLDAGAERKILDMKFDGQMNVTTYPLLHLAVLGGHVEMVKLLLSQQETKVGELNAQRQTALHLAVSQKKIDIVKVLCQHGDIVVDCFDQSNQTPLLVAIAGVRTDVDSDEKSIEIIEYLLNEAGAAPSYTEETFPENSGGGGFGYGGFGRKRRAWGNNRNDDDEPADPKVEKRDAFRNNIGDGQPLHRACNLGNSRIIEMIVDAGADVNFVSSRNITAMDQVIQRRESLETPPDHEEIESTARQLEDARAGSWTAYVLQRYLNGQLGGHADLAEWRKKTEEAEVTRKEQLAKAKESERVLKRAKASKFTNVKLSAVDKSLIQAQKEAKQAAIRQRAQKKQRTEPLPDITFQYCNVPEVVPNTWGGYGNVASDSQNIRYHQLFNAIYAGQVKKVDKLTIDLPINEQLHVASRCSLTHLTTLDVAALRGDSEMLMHLIEICTAQFTPIAKPKAKEGQPKAVMNNYDLVAVMRGMQQGESLMGARERDVADPNAPKTVVNCTTSTRTLLENQDQNNRMNVLHYAAFFGHDELVQELLRFLSVTSIPENDYSDIEPTRKPPSAGSMMPILFAQKSNQSLTPFELALATENTAVAQAILDAGGATDDATQDSGASKEAQYAGLDVAGKKMGWAQEATGGGSQRTKYRGLGAAHVCAAFDAPESIKFLADYGAEGEEDYLSLSRTNRFGDTALHHAAATVSVKAAVALMKHAPQLINQRSVIGVTPLHVAAKQHEAGVETLVQVLLEAGADVAIPQKHGWTALHVAASQERKQKKENSDVVRARIITTLIQSNPEIIDAKTEKFGQTALMIAAVNGCAGNVATLLEAGANVTDRSTSGDYALHLGVTAQQQQVVEHLIAQSQAEKDENGVGLTCLDASLMKMSSGITTQLSHWQRRNNESSSAVPEQSLNIASSVKKAHGSERVLVTNDDRRAITDILLDQINDSTNDRSAVQSTHFVGEVVPTAVGSRKSHLPKL